MLNESEDQIQINHILPAPADAGAMKPAPGVIAALTVFGWALIAVAVLAVLVMAVGSLGPDVAGHVSLSDYGIAVGMIVMGIALLGLGAVVEKLHSIEGILAGKAASTPVPPL